jgi:ERCC4 domain
MVFWQSPRTVKQARPNIAVPKARAAGLADLEIVVDTRERYAYRFAAQAVTTVSRALPCGDYGVVADGRLVAAVERKSLPDLVSSVTNGKLRYALGDLAALPRAAVVVEDRYSALFKQRHARPAAIADALADYQVRWPTLPIVFCETRPLAEEWTYRYLAAAWHWAITEPAAQARTATTDPLLLTGPRDLGRLADRALTANTGSLALLAKVRSHPVPAWRRTRQSGRRDQAELVRRMGHVAG